MPNYVLNATHAGVAAMSSAGIMARIAGSGLPEDDAPESVRDDGPTAAELDEIEREDKREWRDYNYRLLNENSLNATINTIVW